MTKAPDLRDPVALLERRILLIRLVAAPAFNCTSLCRYTNIERLQNSVCGQNRYAMATFARAFSGYSLTRTPNGASGCRICYAAINPKTVAKEGATV
jgi:hypothetical protein